jgi:hypothetical protein
MNFIELRGVDHQTVLRWEDWEAMLSLAYRAGWRTKTPARILFRPRNTCTLPAWACPSQEGESQTANARETRRLAQALKAATDHHRRAPPLWWHRGDADRLEAWRTFIRTAQEIVYLLRGGMVSLAMGDEVLPV